MPILAFLISFTMLLTPPSFAAQNSPPDMQRKADFSILNTQDLNYKLEIVDFEDNNRAYIAIPKIKAPANGFASLFILDGNAAISKINTKQLQELKNPPVLVFIARTNDFLFDQEFRANNYTPTKKDGSINTVSSDFMKLLDTKIRPAISKKINLDINNQTLLGHSLGGLFTLYTFLNQTSGFTNFVIADPSLWWGDAAFFKKNLAELKNGKALAPAKIWILQSHKRPPKIAKTKEQQVLLDNRLKELSAAPDDASKQIADEIAKRKGIKLIYKDYPALTHSQLFEKSLSQAITIVSD